MGGFVLDTREPISIADETTRFSLTPSGVLHLMQHAPHLIPNISLDALEDRSKVNSLSKAALVFQVLYFCVSCVMRRVARLPLSLLEVTTLAHALCALCTYAVWWTKPLDILEPTIITSEGAEVAEIAATLLMDSATCTELPGGIFHFTYSCETKFLDIATKPKPSHTLVTMSKEQAHIALQLGQAVQIRDKFYSLGKNHNLHPRWKRHIIFGRTGLPWYTRLQKNPPSAVLSRGDIARWTLREHALERTNQHAAHDDHRPPAVAGFLRPSTTLGGVSSWDVVFGERGYLLIAVCTGCTAMYGLPHILGWNVQFPTLAEQHVWRIASVTLSVFPLLLLASLPAVFFVFIIFLFSVGLFSNIIPESLFRGVLEPDSGKGKETDHMPVLFNLVVPFGFMLYLLASGFLLVMSILQLWTLDHGSLVFTDSAITRFWPHIS